MLQDKQNGLADFFNNLRTGAPSKFFGRFFAEVWENGKQINEDILEFPNAATLAGLNDILGVYLANSTQRPNWYFMLVDNAGFTAFSTADTMASHTGWTESVAYSEATRQAWTPGTVAGQSVTNPVQATFTMNASVSIKGAGITSVNTKSATTGMLWATGGFAAVQSLVSTQELKITYSAAASG